MFDWMAYVHKGEAEIARLRALVRWYWEPNKIAWCWHDLGKLVDEETEQMHRERMEDLAHLEGMDWGGTVVHVKNDSGPDINKIPEYIVPKVTAG